MSKTRKGVRTRIRSELSNFNTNVETRRTRFIADKNAYLKRLEEKKLQKTLREKRKQAKFHIGNRKRLRKYAELEAEYMTPFD